MGGSEKVSTGGCWETGREWEGVNFTLQKIKIPELYICLEKFNIQNNKHTQKIKFTIGLLLSLLSTLGGAGKFPHNAQVLKFILMQGFITRMK